MSKRYEEESFSESLVDEERRNEELPLTEDEIERRIIDEDQEATIQLYHVVKQYLEDQSLPYPFMDRFNQMNFMIWFSEHLGNKFLRYQ